MTDTPVKPMLSATLLKLEDAEKLQFPCYISAKIDGVRATTNANGNIFTRKGKPVMNQVIRDEFQKMHIPFLDGELGLGDPTAPAFFNETSGMIRRKSADFEKMQFYVFDRPVEGGYEDRFIQWEVPLLQTSKSSKIEIIKLTQKKVVDWEQFLAWEERFVDQGYEGIMIRSNLAAQYKHGRPSIKSAELIKFKRFEDDEATITGFEQAMQNDNEKTEDAFGNSKRSSHKENKTPLDMVGVILGQCDNFDGVVRIGTGIGLTHDLKKDMFANPHNYIGRKFKFKYQAGSDYEKVRFGSFQGFRDGVDDV